jgi:Lipopolysaccharide-assembly
MSLEATNSVSRTWQRQRCAPPQMRRRFNLGAAAILTFCCGCGYTVGNGFAPDVKTVSVPIFENDTYRRGIEYQLTEAVQKEIQKRTPYRLAKGANADTRLTGRIIQTRKDVLGENADDDPRQLQFSIMVRVTWENLRTGEVLAQQEVPVSPEAIPLISSAQFAPELGQSQATALQTAIDNMARHIVNMMETPW